MPHNQLRAFSVPKQDLSRIEQCCVGWTAIRFNTADTGLDLFLGNWITTHLVCNSWRSTAVLTGTSNSQVPPTKWKKWWNADITPWHENWARLMTFNLEEIHRSFKPDDCLLTILFISHFYWFRERNEYLAKMKPPAQAPWRGNPQKRGHRLHRLKAGPGEDYQISF